jgi:hypothetical protein
MVGGEEAESMKANRNPKKAIAWAVYNWGYLWGVFLKRREARQFAEQTFAENQLRDQRSWHEVFEIHKIRIEVIPRAATTGAGRSSRKILNDFP